MSTSPLGWVHANRVRAAEREITGLLAEILSIARDGIQPSGHVHGNAAYTPLDPGTVSRLSDALSEIAGSARRVGELAGPSEAPAEARGPAATRAAISARLARIDEALKDVHPARLQEKYGELPQDTAAQLEGLCRRIEEQVGQAREVVARR